MSSAAVPDAAPDAADPAAKPAGGATVAEVLARTAQELAELAQSAEALQAETSAASRDLDPEFLISLQGLDRLTQHLAALSAFLQVVATEAPAGQVDLNRALAGVPLSDLAARLGGAEAQATQGGELEFF